MDPTGHAIMFDVEKTDWSGAVSELRLMDGLMVVVDIGAEGALSAPVTHTGFMEGPSVLREEEAELLEIRVGDLNITVVRGDFSAAVRAPGYVRIDFAGVYVSIARWTPSQASGAERSTDSGD